MMRRCAAVTAAALCRSASTAPSHRSASASSRRSTCRGPAERTGKRGSTPYSAPLRRFTSTGAGAGDRCSACGLLRPSAAVGLSAAGRLPPLPAVRLVDQSLGPGTANARGVGVLPFRAALPANISRTVSPPDSRPTRPQPAASCRHTDVVNQFRNSDEDARAISRALHVGYLLDGNVRPTGSMVRVSAELIDGGPASANGPALSIGHWPTSSPSGGDRPGCDQCPVRAAPATGRAPG